jgi:hypothetical protein
LDWDAKWFVGWFCWNFEKIRNLRFGGVDEILELAVALKEKGLMS